MVLGDIFHGPRPLKMDQEFPSNKFVIPIGFSSKNSWENWQVLKITHLIGGVGKKWWELHTFQEKCSNFFSHLRKKLEVAHPGFFPLHEGKMSFFWKKKRQQCRNFIAVSQFAIWELKKPKVFHSSFTFRPSDTRINNWQVFPPSATKYMPPWQFEWFFSQLDYHLLIFGSRENADFVACDIICCLSLSYDNIFNQ